MKFIFYIYREATITFSKIKNHLKKLLSVNLILSLKYVKFIYVFHDFLSELKEGRYAYNYVWAQFLIPVLKISRAEHKYQFSNQALTSDRLFFNSAPNVLILWASFVSSVKTV